MGKNVGNLQEKIKINSKKQEKNKEKMARKQENAANLSVFNQKFRFFAKKREKNTNFSPKFESVFEENDDFAAQNFEKEKRKILKKAQKAAFFALKNKNDAKEART